MYHHHSQQQGSQAFSNGPRPPHHQPPPNQHQNRNSSDMLSQAMGFQFPRPTQLPDELESALAIRGSRDMDHRLIDHMSRPNQHQSQGSAPGISQHGSFGSNPMTLTSVNHPAHQQGVDWSSYQPPTKLFSSPPPSASHQPPRHPGPQQQPQSSHPGPRIQSWKTNTSDCQSPQARHPLGSGESQSMYTPESAGSILASFGLSNEDLEVLSHYPDDQLTPDTLPFILRDIQINKSGSQNTVTSAASSSFTSGIQEMPRPHSRSRSPEVPSLLTVTQTAGKVIDYGHASRAKEETTTRKTFKREPLSTERTVKMYQTSVQSSSPPKSVKAERRQVRLEHTEPSKHGDQDYRGASDNQRKSNRSPGKEFQRLSKPRNLDRDYRREAPKPRPSSETRSEASLRRSLSSSSGSKLHSSSKKLPTPTMISDFSAVSPKVYPHTCSLCHTQCDQEKDWVDHVNTVNHTAACRDLRNKYPDWKPNPPRSGRPGSRGSWDSKDCSPSQSASRSLSCSPSLSPPHSKHRVGPHHHRPHGRPYSPHHHPRHQHYAGNPSRGGLKRLHGDSARLPSDTRRYQPSSRAGHGSRHGPSQSSTKTVKSGMKSAVKTTKTSSVKAADSSVKPPPPKKKKKAVTPASQDTTVANRLVYLTGIPKDASEQEVTDLVGSFGKINNVILMACSEEEKEKGEGQKASVCMVKAEDAQALANSTNLSIRKQPIAASTAKKTEELKSSDDDSSKATLVAEKSVAEEDTVPAAGSEADLKMSDEKGMVLITGLPESGWSESDIINLVEPFGTPSDIVTATQIGKVLLSVPDVETAQELVKVHSFKPFKVGDVEVKIIHLRQSISLSTPVALYNLFMGTGATSESPAPVGWSSLLVISNVPSTPSGPSEVQKLVRRFGTVIKTLVLNSMVICEMATAAMALSVYKRFQTFPCIIHNNPLFFSRKTDPRANTQSKVIPAYLDPTEETSANGKGSKTSEAAEEEEITVKEDAKSVPQVKEKDVHRKEEKMKSTEKIVVEDKALEEKKEDKNQEVKKELTDEVSESVAAPDTKPEEAAETNKTETADEKTDVNASTDGSDESASGEATKTSVSDGREATQETLVVEPPKANQEMVNMPLEESDLNTNSNSKNNAAAATNGEQGETQPEKEQSQKSAAEPKELLKNHAGEEKKQERELKERESRKEKERKEKERKEKDRRALESKERARKERERVERAKRERERREEERRERERRERRRIHGEDSTGWRSSNRSEGQKRSSEREKRSGPATKPVEEEEDDFPFNLSDFVTVDEVGDVADLPSSPSEMTGGEEDAPVFIQKDDSEETSAEAPTEKEIPVTTATTVKSDELKPEGEPVNEPTPSTPDQQPHTSHSQPSEPTCQLEAPETETKPTSTLDLDPLPTPTDLPSNSPGTEVVTAESEEEQKENDILSYNQVEEEKRENLAVSKQTEESGQMQIEETKAPAAETGKHKRSEDQLDIEKASVRKKLKTESPTSTDDSLPPFDPSVPVGLEFLVPKTGFFCKACNRFFSGNKEAEISHCKTLKHYDNLQKFLQTRKITNDSTKPVLS